MVIFALVLLTCGWISVRGVLAKQALEEAIPLAMEYKSAVVSGDNDKAIQLDRAFSERVDSAASLTSDPVWRIAEAVPGIGPNLHAFAEAAAVAKSVSDHAVSRLTDILRDYDLSSFKPVDGAFDLDSVQAVAAPLSDAAAAVATSDDEAAAIPTDNVLPPVRDGVAKLQSALGLAHEGLAAIDRAAKLLPSMLGDEKPRRYFLLFQNPAELRATGGIASAGALILADGGKLDLIQQVSSEDFPHYAEPVTDLPDETESLYGDIMGRYLQDVNLTPNFPLSAQLASTMWQTQFGSDVDGVISVDPVALSYILKATGPIKLDTGDTLDAGNAVRLLLSDVYARYPDPKAQDAFFASAAAMVFEHVSSGHLDVSALMSAITRAGNESRVYVWSTHDEEQKLLEETTLAGRLPISGDEVQRFGVYLNDATGGKMDYYLDTSVGIGSTICRKDERPYYVVSVSLTNAAPKDAADSLPEYVTGGGGYGVTPGNVKTQVNAYAPRGFTSIGMLQNGKATGYRPALDAGYAVSQAYAELKPGETVRLEFGFLGDAPFDGDLTVDITPVIEGQNEKSLTPTCDFALW